MKIGDETIPLILIENQYSIWKEKNSSQEEQNVVIDFSPFHDVVTGGSIKGLQLIGNKIEYFIYAFAGWRFDP